MKMHNTGFTLIELMIVVAIIGVLAAIALPTYQNFIVRSQITEALILLDAARMNTEDRVSTLGEFPSNRMGLVGINTRIDGIYGDITGTANLTSEVAGDIVFLFKSANINSNIKGKSVWYSRDVNGTWACKTDLEYPFAPRGCIPNQTPAPTGL